MATTRFSPLTPLPAQEGRSVARGQPLQRIAETAEYVSQRTLQLDEQIHEVDQIVQHMGALARQLRTLSSNTMLEANRMRMSGPLAEIARQMRRISQQISESNDQLGMTLRGYAAATGDLHQAATALLRDVAAPQAALEEPAPPASFPTRAGRTSPDDPGEVPRRPTARQMYALEDGQ